MRKIAFWTVSALFALALVSTVQTPVESQLKYFTSGDTLLASAGSFKIYPCFTSGGAHMHVFADITDANRCTQHADGGYLYTTASELRVVIHGRDVRIDTTAFSLPSGASFTAIPQVDSISVLNIGNAETKVTWGLWR